jgi:hypothetical protein
MGSECAVLFHLHRHIERAWATFNIMLNSTSILEIDALFVDRKKEEEERRQNLTEKLEMNNLFIT